MSTENDNVTITLTDARPMRVSKKNWPLVARATENTDHNNQELFRRYYLRVRWHAVETKGDTTLAYHGGKDGPAMAPYRDERAVVYGWHESSCQGEGGVSSGYACTMDECAEMIRRVGEAIGADESLIMECIGDLPPCEENEEETSALQYTLENKNGSTPENGDWYIMLGDRIVAKAARKSDAIVLIELANAAL